MKNALLLIVFLFSSILGSVAGERTTKEFPKHYTTDEKIAALSTLWSELKYNFVFADRLTFDQDSLYRAYLPQISATENDVEFFNLLKRYIARFNDGHTSIPDYSYKWKEVYDFAPLLFETIGNRYYIARLWESSGLDSLALGAELVDIEGVPAQEYVKEHYFPEIAHGSESAKYAAAGSGYIGTGLPNSHFRGVLKQQDGTMRPFDIRNNYYQCQNRNGRYWEWTGFRKPRKARVSLEWLKDDIAWLDFRFFDDKDAARTDSMLNVIGKQASALILDLRYCPGGSSLVGNRLMTYLVDADYCLTGGARTRLSTGYGRAQGNWRPEYEDIYQYRAFETLPSDTLHIDRSKHLRCPVVILTDKYTASAAETFLVQLYELPNRPRIIGRQTEGSTGAPLVIDLPHDACVRICTLCHLFPVSGKPFINDGIRPDIPCSPTVEDYLSGRDRALEQAIKTFNKK
ncbi:MAG: S41 family peptidase [Alistipes sp.]